MTLIQVKISTSDQTGMMGKLVRRMNLWPEGWGQGLTCERRSPGEAEEMLFLLWMASSALPWGGRGGTEVDVGVGGDKAYVGGEGCLRGPLRNTARGSVGYTSGTGQPHCLRVYAFLACPGLSFCQQFLFCLGGGAGRWSEILLNNFQNAFNVKWTLTVF